MNLLELKRVIKRTIKLAVRILRDYPWCNYLRSLCISMKWGGGGIIVISSNTKFIVEKNAKLDIQGKLIINKPWTGKQVYPASFVIKSGGSVAVKGSFEFLNGCDISVNDGAELTLGSGYMNNHGQIACFKAIDIGSGVCIGPNVAIRDSDNHSMIRDGFEQSKPIQIGNHVWIGSDSSILKGVSIEEGAVIAAGSVVHRSIPAHSLAAGVPCVVKEKDIQWE